jgi:hypothetical protein
MLTNYIFEQTFFTTVFVDMVIPSDRNVDGGSGTAPSGTGRGNGTQLLIHDQIWIEFICMIVLILSTGGLFWFWDRRRQTSTT